MATRISRAIGAGFVACAVSFAPVAFAACNNCGTVTSVETIKKEGEGSGAGAVIGGIAGGVLGHQVGSGRGNTLATVAGAGAGAYAGNKVEKSRNATTTYAVHIKMEDGKNRTFNFKDETSYRTGDKVKVVDGKLVRQ